ncbi:hypothetical protein [Sphingobacterium paludis]|uniref:Uncharacterized protein n=1 Tax=Sphingobacterium paludis TaxID=1476465 RepID=A0A4R7D4V7_9SPHI|nr:hypothetical protein [Sphingobacterium paludis]TDS14735.1 hypothetical protein B0I21_103234 [Sphingobacterium paludis]
MRKIKQTLIKYQPELTGLNLIVCAVLSILLGAGLYRQTKALDNQGTIIQKQDSTIYFQESMMDRDHKADSVANSLLAQLDSINSIK